MERRRVKITATVPPELEARLKALAEAERRPFSRTLQFYLEAGIRAVHPRSLTEQITVAEFAEMTADENPVPEEEQPWQRRYDTP